MSCSQGIVVIHVSHSTSDHQYPIIRHRQAKYYPLLPLSTTLACVSITVLLVPARYSRIPVPSRRLQMACATGLGSRPNFDRRSPLPPVRCLRPERL